MARSLTAPQQARGSGRLTVHAIQLDAGPLTKAVASVLQLQAPAIRLIDNSVVPFLMADGRVEHRDLVFRLKNTTVETSGSVGLDQSLDMMVAISLSGSLLGNGPLAEAIRQHPIRLPLRGTLSHPRIEPAALRSANGALRGAVDQWLNRLRSKGEGGGRKAEGE